MGDAGFNIGDMGTVIRTFPTRQESARRLKEASARLLASGRLAGPGRSPFGVLPSRASTTFNFAPVSFVSGALPISVDSEAAEAPKVPCEPEAAAVPGSVDATGAGGLAGSLLVMRVDASPPSSDGGEAEIEGGKGQSPPTVPSHQGVDDVVVDILVAQSTGNSGTEKAEVSLPDVPRDNHHLAAPVSLQEGEEGEEGEGEVVVARMEQELAGEEVCNYPIYSSAPRYRRN
jgi:hypothetical protein